MTDTAPTKRPARTPAQRQSDLRARAATLIVEGTENDLPSAADSLLIEAIGTADRRGQSYAVEDIAAELLRRLKHPGQPAKILRVAPDLEPIPVTVTRPEPAPTPAEVPAVTVTSLSDRDAEILALRADGMTLRQIATKLGYRSENSIRHIPRKHAQA